MATVSSHVLDSVSGGPAAGIRVVLIHIRKDNERETIFDTIADQEGRISENVESNDSGDYELLFYNADYFSKQSIAKDNIQIVKTVVMRFSMTDDLKRYHIPIMLSPHSYSTWWS